MAAIVILFFLPLTILSYEIENRESDFYSNPVKISQIVLNNINNGKFIGCKYQNLCPSDRVCFDDSLFGTCLRRFEDGNFAYELAVEFRNLLELAMRDLFDKRYKWADFYTQCFLQSVLLSSELQQYLNVEHCKPNTEAAVIGSPEKDSSNIVDETSLDPYSQLPDIFPRIQRSDEDQEDIDDYNDSIMNKMEDIVPVEKIYHNKEMINPKSNSKEANSVTKVKYADPNMIRKILKVAKRSSNEWIWLKFNKKVSPEEELEVIKSIEKSMKHEIKITQPRWNSDRTTLYFKLLSDSQIRSENITTFFNSHKNVLPGLVILETGTKKQRDQNFIITLIICSVVFLGVILVLIGFCIQKFRYKRNKLGEIIKSKLSDNSSSSYKELFRVTTNKDTAVKAKQGVARMNSKQHSGETPAASSPVSTRSSTSSWTDEMQVVTNMDIYTGHMILSYMEKHLKNKDIFQSEWNSILSYEAEDSKTDAAIKVENLPKNRYQDKLPYDKSRVILKNKKDGDYINASLIMDHDPKVPVYIATQAPLEKRIPDFWQMVWEQGVVIIVNLTETHEKECTQYWPKEGSQLYNIYEVNLVSEHIWSDEYLVRNFYLKNLDTGETRTVTQFHFVCWSADKIPSSSRSILEFRRKVNKSYRSKSTPIVIHCNDGCGRTGTYILLDLILNRICKGLKEMDIAATLEHLRDQRMHLVKTEEQFGFVLTTISEEVNNILKVLNQ